MPIAFETLQSLYDHGFDTVIDVRSPAEFAEDHIPGAISLPAMSNEERAEVGTIYKQVSPFDARKIGAAILARNVATHLDGPLADKDGSWRPLVYCWRGGQRSGSVTIILQQVGWRADTIKGGYQTYRRLVFGALYEQPLPYRFVLIDGNTGTGKTDLLRHIKDLGGQVIDLEGLANHRGSLLGSMQGGQPSQKWFESLLCLELSKCDPARPIVVEAESSKIGRIVLPPSLWEAMCKAPRIEVTADVEARSRYLTRAYGDLTAERDTLKSCLAPLRRIRGNEQVDTWNALIDQSDFVALARSLIVDHYDPTYSKSRAAHEPFFAARIDAGALDEESLKHAAVRATEVLREL